jgi:putative ABC transport system permease protein
VANFDFITADTYRDLTGQALNLKENEIALCMISVANASVFHGGTITIGGTEYRVAEDLAFFPLSTTVTTAFDRYGVGVADKNVLSAINRNQREAYGKNCSELTDKLCVKFVDRAAACEAGSGISREIYDSFLTYLHAQPEMQEDAPLRFRFLSDTLWAATEDIYGMYGSFLFLGILLGLVCLFATALIIYYKQISEGYEDRQRYQIMEKIGMSQQEVKGSIKSQVLLVFFLPLAVAGVHVCFAFPMLTKLLRMLLLSKISLFVLCTVITFLAFLLVYVVIYSLTARTYYKIVH